MNRDPFYYVVLLIGLGMIWQHASLQFEQPIKVDAHRRYDVLNDLEISSLASDATLKLGRVLYVGTYVLIYLLALFFWDNIAELFQLESSEKKEGAQGTPEFLQTLVTNERLGRPLAVAATLMSLLAVGGQLAQYEEPVRRFAHRRAGIPRGIYQIARLVNTLSFSEIGANQPSPRLERFKEKIATLRQAGCTIDSDNIGKIEKQIQKLDLLSPSVIGDQFDYTFDFSKIDALSTRIDKLRADVQTIDDDIAALSDKNCGVHEMSRLSDKILKQENNLVAMLAVLYLNTKGFDLTIIPAPTSHILEELSIKRRSYEFPAIIWASAGTILFSLFFYFVVQRLSLMVKDGTWSSFFSEDQMTVAANWSMRSLVEHVLLVLTVAAIAILKRQETIDQDSWSQSFPNNQPPIGQYLSSAIVPALVGCGLLISVVLAEGLYDMRGSGDEIVSLVKLIDTSSRNYAYFVGSFFASIVLAIGVFFISDLHGRLAVIGTCLIGVIFGIVFSLVSLTMFEIMHGFDQRLAITDAAKMSVFAILFLGLYAWAIELYEPGASKHVKETQLPPTVVNL